MRYWKTALTVLAILGLVMLGSPATQAQTCTGKGSKFVDLNGDGFNDNAPDHDGDGIPNGLDPDWIKQAKTGDGYKNGQQGEGSQGEPAKTKTMTKSQKFNRLQKFNGYAFRHRIGAQGGMNGGGAGICDGSGGGPGGPGTGVNNGNGPHRSGNRGGK